MTKFTKAERNFLRSIIEALTLDRYTEKEILDFLKERHNINIDRSYVSRVRTGMEKDGKTWYDQLRQSDYKYFYTFKERIDSLTRYQRRLNEIVNKEESSDFLRIQAIKELHKIEISLARLYGNLHDIVIDNNEYLSTLEPQQTINTPATTAYSEQPTVF